MPECTKCTASLLKYLPNLKLSKAMSNLSIDIKAANARGVVGLPTGGAGNTTLEHILALNFGVMTHVAEEERNMKEVRDDVPLRG